MIRYRSSRALWERTFPSALENFHAGRKLLYVRRERNRTMLFLYTRGKILVKSVGSGEPSSPNFTVHLSRMTSCSTSSLLLSVRLVYADVNASLTSHLLPCSSRATRLWLEAKSSVVRYVSMTSGGGRPSLRSQAFHRRMSSSYSSVSSSSMLNLEMLAGAATGWEMFARPYPSVDSFSVRTFFIG